jgi:hypothetical protein
LKVLPEPAKELERTVAKGSIIFLVLRYGCETWSLTLREEHSLTVLENIVLRRILRSKREEVTGETAEICTMKNFIDYAVRQISLGS